MADPPATRPMPGGVAGRHVVIDVPPALVGPATGEEFNTIVAGIIPVACWRVDDIRFAFGSSFVTPAVKAELGHLTQLIKEHPGAPLSVFGHADPVGSDDLNKRLSGRRAMAIYGMLIRDPAMWEDLFSRSEVGDVWGAPALRTMHAEVNGPPPGGGAPDVSGLQGNAGQRRALYLAYMDKLCGPELKLQKTDFLARGADTGGKGDFQGCSEFNPVFLFSQQDQQRFDAAADKTERNAENAPNRRVMVLLFRRGTKVEPARWPCPRAREGVAGCRKRFWSDGEQRRTRRLPAEPRTFEATEDTFACRFYHRLTTGSPCEKPTPPVAQIVKIKATLPSTPPNTLRAAPAAVANAWPNPVDLTFESTKALTVGPLAFAPADFNMPSALVVMRNGEGPIRLEAETVPPGAQIAWEITRATDDAQAVGTGIPLLAATGPNTATLMPNERGSFFVLAFVDLNGNTVRDDDETGIILPVVMAEGSIANAATELRSVANPGNLSITFDTGGQSQPNFAFVSIDTGDFLSQASAGVAFDADVLLVGGGPDGQRGLDRVFTGWANNFTALNYAGTYADASVCRRRQVDNRGDAHGTPNSNIPVFISTDNAPNLIAFPPSLLDTGRTNPDRGGEEITFTRSQEAAPVAQAVGVKRTVIARDSPGWFHDRNHPGAKPTQLQSFVHDLHSTTFLVAWTNTTGGAPPTPAVANSVGFRTFTVIAETQWTVSATFNVARVGPNFVLQSTGAPGTITATNVDHSPGTTAVIQALEVRPPTTLRSRAIDAQ